jgi:hypothetical protein
MPSPSALRRIGREGTVDEVVGGMLVVVVVEVAVVTVVTAEALVEVGTDEVVVAGASPSVVGSDSSGAAHPPNPSASTNNTNHGGRIPTFLLVSIPPFDRGGQTPHIDTLERRRIS